FNVHWPHTTTTTGPATATTYGNNYNCSGTPLVNPTTLRCDDPVQPSGWEAPALTFSTITLDSVVEQTWTGSAWQTMRAYNFGYAQDLPGTSCTDDVTGQSYVCAGEHLLTSVQEIPYQSGTAMPSRQPITFTYTARLRDEYKDDTQTGFNGLGFDAQ